MPTPEAQSPDRWSRRYPWLLALAVVVAFGNGLGGPFVYDDDVAIVGNESIRSLWPPWRPLSPPVSTPAAGRPVVNLTLAINYAAGGLDVGGYHLFNVAVHMLSALLLYGIVRRTLRCELLRARFGGSADRLALLVALIWAVHPVQTEAVDYITQRTELIVGFFYLLTLYCAIRALDPAAPLGWSLAAVGACGLGMASKEVMVTAPIMVLLYDWTFAPAPTGRPPARRAGLYAGLAATWVILAALQAAGPRASTVGLAHGVGVWQYALNQSVAIVRYLRLSLWPDPLVLDYGFPGEVTIGDAAPYVTIVAVLVMLSAWGRLRKVPLAFAGAWFFLILAPTSSFIPIATEVAAERRMYLPLAAVVATIIIGAFLLLAAWPAGGIGGAPATNRATAWRLGARAAAPALAVAVVSVLVWITWRRNADYRSPLVLWQQTVEAVAHNHRARTNLGIALIQAGRLDEAIVEFHRAIEIDPDASRAHYNLGNALATEGDLDGAIEQYRRTVALRPDTAEAHYNLGIALGKQGLLSQAAAAFGACLQLRPDDAEAEYHLAVALRSMGRADEAVEHGRRALDRAPDDASAHFLLGVLLDAQGRSSEALEHFRRSSQLSPDWADPLQAAAWLLATDPDPGVRNADEAIRCARRATQLTGQRDPAALDALAAAYASGGRYEEAVETARRAVALAGTELSARAIQLRLDLYTQAQPFRDGDG